MKRPRGKALGMAAQAREMGISRQRLWQIMQNAEGKCSMCAQKIWRNGLCKTHYAANRIYARKWSRKVNGYKPKVEGGRGRPIEYQEVSK